MDMRWYRRRGLMVTPHIESSTGAIATFNSEYNKALINRIVCDINPIQEGSGDPSPLNVRPIIPITVVNAEISGKDIYPDMDMVNGYYDANGNIITSNVVMRCTNYIPVNPGEKVAFLITTSEATSSRLRVHSYDSEYNWLRQDLVSNSLNSVGVYKFVVTIGENAKYIRFSLPVNTVVQLYVDYSNIETDLGRSVYGGTLDVVSGKLTVVKTSIPISELTWTYQGDYSRFNTTISDIVAGKYATREVPLLCPVALTIDDGRALADVPYNSIYGAGTSRAIYIKTEATTLEEFLSIYGGYTIVYELAEAIEYQLTSHQLKTVLGENNLWCDSGNVTVDYWKWSN